MCDWICKFLQPDVLVQWLIFVGLIWYAFETWKVRKAAQKQNEIMQTPCLVPLVRESESSSERMSALLWSNERLLDGTSGDTGFVVLHNIGNSPAFKIQYGIHGHDPDGFLPYILKRGKEPTTLSLQKLRDEFSSNQDDNEVAISLSYHSLVDRRYNAKIHIREGLDSELVVSKCQFQS